jgi:hypothetical protein
MSLPNALCCVGQRRASRRLVAQSIVVDPWAAAETKDLPKSAANGSMPLSPCRSHSSGGHQSGVRQALVDVGMLCRSSSQLTGIGDRRQVRRGIPRVGD